MKIHVFKTIALYFHNQPRISYWRILLYNPIVGYYDSIQQVIILELDLVQCYSSMC